MAERHQHETQSAEIKRVSEQPFLAESRDQPSQYAAHGERRHRERRQHYANRGRRQSRRMAVNRQIELEQVGAELR